MRIELEKNDLMQIAEWLVEKPDGRFMEIELSNLLIEVEYLIEFDGYVEEDTGVYICTFANANIINITSVEVDAEVIFDEKALSLMVESILTR